MKTLKTLMLAGAAALSFGAAGAMAQESPSGGVPDYWGQRNLDAAILQAATANMNQSGAPIQTFRFQVRPSQDSGNQGETLMGGGG